MSNSFKNGSPVSGPTGSDLSSGDLNKLLSSQVISQQRVTRPMDSVTSAVGINHQGVLAQTADNKQWLIHKGNNYGRPEGGNTVITDASNMSNKWTPEGPVQHNTNNVIVGDLIKQGGRDYKLLSDNCIDGTNRMMNAGKK